MLSVMNERDPVISCLMASMNMSFRAGVLVGVLVADFSVLWVDNPLIGVEENELLRLS